MRKVCKILLPIAYIFLATAIILFCVAQPTVAAHLCTMAKQFKRVLLSSKTIDRVILAAITAFVILVMILKAILRRKDKNTYWTNIIVVMTLEATIAFCIRGFIKDLIDTKDALAIVSLVLFAVHLVILLFAAIFADKKTDSKPILYKKPGPLLYTIAIGALVAFIAVPFLFDNGFGVYGAFFKNVYKYTFDFKKAWTGEAARNVMAFVALFVTSIFLLIISIKRKRSILAPVFVIVGSACFVALCANKSYMGKIFNRFVGKPEIIHSAIAFSFFIAVIVVVAVVLYALIESIAQTLDRDAVGSIIHINKEKANEVKNLVASLDEDDEEKPQKPISKTDDDDSDVDALDEDEDDEDEDEEEEEVKPTPVKPTPVLKPSKDDDDDDDDEYDEFADDEDDELEEDDDDDDDDYFIDDDDDDDDEESEEDDDNDSRELLRRRREEIRKRILAARANADEDDDDDDEIIEEEIIEEEIIEEEVIDDEEVIEEEVIDDEEELDSEDEDDIDSDVYEESVMYDDEIEDEDDDSEEEYDEDSEDEEEDEEEEDEEASSDFESDSPDSKPKFSSIKAKPLSEKLFTVLDDEKRERYNIIRNALQSYKKVRERLSSKGDSYRYHGDLIAKITISGKSLRLHLALNPSDFENSKYSYQDLSAKSKFIYVPMTVKLTSKRSVKYALELIDMLAQTFDLIKNPKYVEQDFIQELQDKLQNNQ